MANVPNNILQKVRPFVNCPDPLWECVVQYESNFNQYNVGDGPQFGGYSYGLFQLHVADNGSGGQGNTALAIIKQRTGLTGQAAITYLLQNVDIQAEVGMEAINSAWNHLSGSFNANDRQWWIQFCSMSGHPGGGPNDPITQQYVTNFMSKLVASNAFGIQQVQAGQGKGQTSATPDNTWLQSLINMPAHQPCSIIWRRTCPGAKNANEGGMDLPSPKGTKVYALASGTVVGAGYFWHADGTYGAGVVTVRCTLPDGTTGDLYYQHITISNNIILCNQTGGQLYGGVVGPKPSGQVITAGQLLGTVTFNEVEVGINADWSGKNINGIWGDGHLGPWIDDPEDIIRGLMDTGGGKGYTTPFTTGSAQYDAFLQSSFESAHTALQTLSQNPGIAGPIQVLDDMQKFKPFAVPDDNSAAKNWPAIGGFVQNASYPSRLALGVITFLVNNTFAFFIRSIFVIFALVIIFALIINAVSHTAETVVDGTGGNALPPDESGQSGGSVQTAMKVAELAAL